MSLILPALHCLTNKIISFDLSFIKIKSLTCSPSLIYNSVCDLKKPHSHADDLMLLSNEKGY